jgi:hypothetical protein
VFFSILKHYEQIRKSQGENMTHISPLPHIITSNIEHDSVKLIAQNYEENNLAGNFKNKSN